MKELEQHKIQDSIDSVQRGLDEAKSVFAKHLQVYAENGKEARRLAEAIEKLGDSIQKLEERYNASDKMVKEMFEPFRDAKGIARTVKWSTGIILGLAGIIGAMRIIIKI